MDVEEIRQIIKKETDSLKRLTLLADLAVACLKRGDYNDAISIATEGLSVARATNDQGLIVRFLSSIFRSNLLISNFQEGLKCAIEAIDIVERESMHDKKAQLYRDIGSAYVYLENYEMALSYFLKSEKALSDYGDTTNQTPFLFGSMGILYFRMKEYDKAEHFILEANKGCISSNDEGGLAIGFGHLSRIYREYRKYELAIETLNKALELHKKLNKKILVAIILDDLGETHRLMGSYELSEKYFLEAIEQYKKNEQNTNELSAIVSLARLFLNRGTPEEAIKIIKTRIAQLIQTSNKDLGSAYIILSQAYEHLENYKKAYLYQQKYIDLREKYLNEQLEKRSKNLQIIQDIEKSKNEAEINRLKNVELKKANEEIEEKNKEITDSIRYAKHIQQSILPLKSELEMALTEHFVLYKPKDIVSGDFYWFSNKNNVLIMIVADCTGHGVPGALMSMMGHSLLNQIVNELGITRPDEILHHLDNHVRIALKQDKLIMSNDGMEVACCCIQKDTLLLQFSGANRPMLLISDEGLEEIKPTKRAIGGSRVASDKNFICHQMQLKKGDLIYMSSDGICDQFGGADGKRLMSKGFKNQLTEMKNYSMAEQEVQLNQFFESWKGENGQIDDVLVVGLKV